MTSAKYEDLVRRLEQENERNPARYRQRLRSLAALGYGYIFAVLLGLIALILLVLWGAWYSRSGAGLAVQVAIALGVLVWFVIRVLLIRIEPPNGRMLARDEAPRLFHEVEQMCATLQSPPIDHVIITDEMNAAMARVPRFGLLGWPKNYLVLGLPLLSGMTTGEIRSVIAHELGHHSRSHGKFAAWIYRLRESWYVLVESLENAGHWGAMLFRPFFRWYAPYFGAWSFVLARQQEYEADAIAAELTSPEIAASALLRLNIVAPLADETFWPKVFQEAPFSEMPPDRIYFRLRDSLAHPLQDAEARTLIARALRVATDLSDTHPALRDRLRALGASLAIPAPLTGSAGSHYLEPCFDKLLEEASVYWRAAITPYWPDIREEQSTLRSKYQRLKDTPLTPEISTSVRWERAELIEMFQGAAEAIPAYEAVLAVDPHHVPSLLAVGRLMLDRGERQGLEFLKLVACSDTASALEAMGRIIAFHRSMDEPEQARKFLDDYDQLLDRHELARKERAILNPKDALEPHGLEAAALSRLVEQLRNRGDVSEAWLAQKKVSHFPEFPVYVFGIKPQTPWWHYRSEGADSEFVQELATSLRYEAETFVITKRAGGTGGLFGRLKRTPESHIFSRSTLRQ